jgi:hypothetical protein
VNLLIRDDFVNQKNHATGQEKREQVLIGQRRRW